MVLLRYLQRPDALPVVAVNKSNGPFDCLFCVGAFFPPSDPATAAAGGAGGQSELEDYIAGRAKAPLPTFLIGDIGVGAQRLLEIAVHEAVPSLPASWIQSALPVFHPAPFPPCSAPTGLKVAYLGGRYDPATYLSGQAGGTGVAEGRQERAAVEALVDAGADGAAIDVLLTNEWPKGVAALTHPSLLPSPPPATSASAPASVDWAGVGSPVAATLAKELMPRPHVQAPMCMPHVHAPIYHVAGGAGAFFARPPYINSSAATSAEDASTSASGPVTRFIGLAPVGNKAKQKFLHALSLRPASSLPLSDLAARPPDATPSPFLPRPTSAKNQIWTGSLAAPDGAARAAAAAAQAKAEETAAKRTFWESSDGGKGGGEGAVKACMGAKGKKRARRDGGPGGGGREGPQVCFELSGKGVCSRGDACRFMHTLEDGSPLPRNLCFEHFSKGSCSRGTDCRFRHSLAGGEAGGGAGEGQGGGGNAAAGSVAAAVATAAAVAAAAAGVGGSSGGATDLPKGVCFDLQGGRQGAQRGELGEQGEQAPPPQRHAGSAWRPQSGDSPGGIGGRALLCRPTQGSLSDPDTCESSL
ncbi:unnamed protein product [Closterium sp. NIES-64]|nr:unnamed protein product [Closterium sp. NIES-64]